MDVRRVIGDNRPREPGTYVMVYHLPTPLNGVVVGRLGKFDFPAGFYAYVGSAFGSGGVQARTDYHLRADSGKFWNIDFLKPFARPLAVWWTMDPVKWECRWAELVGGLPGASVPAPAFGARDCKRCEAHLHRFGRRPSFPAFARAVAGRLAGHGPVYQTLVRGAGGDRTEEGNYA